MQSSCTFHCVYFYFRPRSYFSKRQLVEKKIKNHANFYFRRWFKCFVRKLPSVCTYTDKIKKMYYKPFTPLFSHSTVQKFDTVWCHMIRPKLFLQHVNNPKHTVSCRELSAVPGTHSAASDGKSGITGSNWDSLKIYKRMWQVLQNTWNTYLQNTTVFFATIS